MNMKTTLIAAGLAGVAKYPAITGADYLAARLNATYDHRQTSPS